MPSTRSLFGVSALGFAAASSCTGTPKIQWQDCPEALGYPNTTRCAAYDVPMDYMAPEANETLSLSLVQVPAPKQPSKGSILFNFGGPGDVANAYTPVLKDTFFPLTGGEYDLVSFDPRGTGNTIPFNCYVSDAEFADFMGNQRTANISSNELGRLWGRGSMDSWLCANRATEAGRVISTAFTARDLISVVDGLGEDGKLRFWGQSYGTTLGVTAAAMFPERIDKLVLDGVQNPHEYYHAQATYEQWASADGHFSGFFEHCLAYPKECVLAPVAAALNLTTAAELEAAAWDAIEALKSQPVVIPATPAIEGVSPAIPPSLLDYTFLKGALSTSFYAPAATTAPDGWRSTAQMLAAVMGPQFPLIPLKEPLPDTQKGILKLPSYTEGIAMRGIQCGDSRVRTEKFEDFAPALQQGLATSRLFGDLNFGVHSACNQWRIEPSEAYEGGFDDLRIGEVGAERPVLVLANSFDAHTSVESGRNITATFANSALLETEGFGHASLANPSRCAAEVIKAYWTEGALPENGMLCDSNPSPFSNVTWDDILVDL